MLVGMAGGTALLVAVLVLGEGFGLLHVAAAAITLVGVGLVRWPA